MGNLKRSFKLTALAPICFQVCKGQFHKTKYGKYEVDIITNYFDPSEFPHERLKVKTQKLKDIGDEIKLRNDSSYEFVKSMFKLSDYDLDRVYYSFNELGLLEKFDPMLKQFNINWDNFELWKKYKCSRFWRNYYESDKTKTKFVKMGINYDELENDFDEFNED